MERMGRVVASTGAYEIVQWLDFSEKDGHARLLGYRLKGPFVDGWVFDTLVEARVAMEILADEEVHDSH